MKNTPTISHYGYRLRINRSGQPGAANWESAGYVFDSTYEANEYRKRYHSKVDKYTIVGVRLNTSTLKSKGE